MKAEFLSPEQQFGARWLLERGGSYLADPPGYGKTRQLLAACESERHVTVVCPAAIRDSKVWEREAAAVGFDVPITSMSYHQLPKTLIKPGGALIFDEAHRLKSRKTSWNSKDDGDVAGNAAAASTRVHLASGTPTPNGISTELYAQMRLINPAIPEAYWQNKAGTGWVETWLHVSSSRFSQWVVDGRLLACMGLPCEPVDYPGDCEHRQAFWAANVGDLMLRRPEESLDLPDMAGFEDPLDTPMTRAQAKAYKDLKKSLLADIPEEGLTLEALSATRKFVMLHQLCTGLAAVDPEASTRESGKRLLLEELLPDRSHPTVLGVYFRNTAAFMAKICEDLKLRYAMFGADTPGKDKVIERFQAGDLDILIASIMVAREGITLTAADQLCMVERSWVPGDNEQMARRIRRRGQTKSVAVRQLVTPEKSVDFAQWSTIRGKAGRIGRMMSRSELMELI